jgi:tetratricopeptide (TPR) repeat protein
VGNRYGEAVTLNNIGLIYQSLGERQKALEKFDESLLIRRAVGDRRGEALALNNIGGVYRSLGEMQKALEKFNEALPILRAVGNRSVEAITLHNIGSAYRSLGETQKALEKFNESLTISQTISDRTGLGKEVKGEGLVGLTRGFMYAGAARVVASLWRVDDTATAELMKLFYRRMLRDGIRGSGRIFDKCYAKAHHFSGLA